jgi:hypothetical protein
MFETIKRIYKNTKNKQLVVNAVIKGFISKEDYQQIVGEAYPES